MSKTTTILCLLALIAASMSVAGFSFYRVSLHARDYEFWLTLALINTGLCLLNLWNLGRVCAE